MNILQEYFLRKKLLNDRYIPKDINRLRAMILGSIYFFDHKVLSLTKKTPDKELNWLIFKKAYLSLDTSMNFIERYKNKKLFKWALKKAWGSENKHQLLKEINYLFDGSNSHYANAQLNLYYELKEKDLSINEDNITKTTFFNYYYKDLDREEMLHLIGALNLIDNNKYLLTSKWVLGFDLARIVHVTRMGYCTKILSENEAWEIIDRVYIQLAKFETYADFFASHELGIKLFEYDRKLDAREEFIKRYNFVSFILLYKRTTPFKYLTIADDVVENPEEIFRKIFPMVTILEE